MPEPKPQPELSSPPPPEIPGVALQEVPDDGWRGWLRLLEQLPRRDLVALKLALRRLKR